MKDDGCGWISYIYDCICILMYVFMYKGSRFKGPKCIL